MTSQFMRAETYREGRQKEREREEDKQSERDIYKKVEMYRQTDRWTARETDRRMMDNRRFEKITWAFTSGELKIVEQICKL